MEAMTDFILLGSKINVDNDCSREIKRHLLLGKKAMTNLDNILKSRDIYLQRRNGDTDVENSLVDTVREGVG